MSSSILPTSRKQPPSPGHSSHHHRDPTQSLRVGKLIGGHLVQPPPARGLGPRFLALEDKVSGVKMSIHISWGNSYMKGKNSSR